MGKIGLDRNEFVCLFWSFESRLAFPAAFEWAGSTEPAAPSRQAGPAFGRVASSLRFGCGAKLFPFPWTRLLFNM